VTLRATTLTGAANVTVSTAAAARQDRTILGVFAIFAITELPPTPRRVVKPDQTFLDKLEDLVTLRATRSLDNPQQARTLLRAAAAGREQSRPVHALAWLMSGQSPEPAGGQAHRLNRP